jgi:hypothetical protein
MEFALSFTTKEEWCGLSHVVHPEHPDELLCISLFRGPYYFLFTHEADLENGFIRYDSRSGWLRLPSTAMHSCLLVANRLEDLQACFTVYYEA